MITKPYEGIKVLDMSTNFAGPLAGAFLADYGADIIHVERPVDGDDSRFFGPGIDGYSFGYMSANRGKKSLVLDLKDPRAIEIVKKLAAEADILIQSFRPGVMDRLGLGYEDIKAINPAIIYVSISAYGQHGPYAGRPGYDIIAQAVSGMMYMTGEQDGPPVKVGTIIGDYMGAMHGFGMIGNAMFFRERTGLGQHIDISLAHLLLWTAARFDYLYTGKMDHRSGNHHTTLAPYGVFSGNNGEAIIIGALNRSLWERLCNVMGKPELITDERFSDNNRRCANIKELVAVIEEWLRGFDNIREAEELLLAASIPCAKVYDHKDIFEDPHFNESGWITQIPNPDDVKSARTRPAIVIPGISSVMKPESGKAASLGQHNHEILERLGYTPEEVDEMEAEWEARARKKIAAKR